MRKIVLIQRTDKVIVAQRKLTGKILWEHNKDNREDTLKELHHDEYDRPTVISSNEIRHIFTYNDSFIVCETLYFEENRKTVTTYRFNGTEFEEFSSFGVVDPYQNDEKELVYTEIDSAHTDIELSNLKKQDGKYFYRQCENCEWSQLLGMEIIEDEGKPKTRIYFEDYKSE